MQFYIMSKVCKPELLEATSRMTGLVTLSPSSAPKKVCGTIVCDFWAVVKLMYVNWELTLNLTVHNQCELKNHLQCSCCICLLILLLVLMVCRDQFVTVVSVFTVRLHVKQCTVLLWEFCPFVKRVHCDKMKSLSSVNIPTSNERGTSLVLLLQQRLLGMIAFDLKYWLKLTHPLFKKELTTAGKKVELSLIGSRLWAF